jgi:hypothetical protein
MNVFDLVSTWKLESNPIWNGINMAQCLIIGFLCLIYFICFGNLHIDIDEELFFG